MSNGRDNPLFLDNFSIYIVYDGLPDGNKCDNEQPAAFFDKDVINRIYYLLYVFKQKFTDSISVWVNLGTKLVEIWLLKIVLRSLKEFALISARFLRIFSSFPE
jgi:hypothetical protein